MDGDMKVSVDKLPVKRLEAIEENGLERFPSDVGYEEKRLSLIRRIDFAWAIEKDDDKKKQKKASKESATPWQWQSMIENLQLAHQELSVIIDLINTVEANDAVTVAGMTRPKPLPNEVLSDLGVSVATKLQCFRHLGKYFKQSAKGLERQVAREARFYGALIRLQQNWKVKRQRVAAPAPANEGFTIDLFDNLSCDPSSVFRPSSSTIRVDRDSSGMLAISLPPNSCHSLRFGFLSGCNMENPLERGKNESTNSSNQSPIESEEFTNDDEYIKETNSLLRQVHHAIFSEQVFDLVNREAFNPSLGINVTGIRENYLQLSIDQGTSVFISLVPTGQSGQTVEDANTGILDNTNLPFDSLDGIELPDRSDPLEKKLRNPNYTTFEIYLQQIFHELVFVKSNDKPISSLSRQSGQPSNDGSGLLGHFCLSLAHRIFANKVLMELENVVWKVPFIQLISHPTWNSRKSSWTFFMEVPQSKLHPPSIQARTSDSHQMKSVTKSQFQTKVVVNDDCITIEGEGAPDVVGLFKGNSKDMYSMNRYGCDLADLPVIILLQVASQIILWLHEEALTWGIKVSRDFLSLSFELEQGETLRLVAHVDPEDAQGCLSWWLVMDDGLTEDRKHNFDISDVVPEYRKFLGHLSLEVLQSTLMDLVSLCSGFGSSL
ncbi:Mediator of RNA polymerase II transcription subunit 17 [Cucurbita argyrosperma subsp. argyrosperma]|nr:Mediator of RNA polymerase II transcription subunit 17 [Cucurbita argyrosperma subsp. argyrosperma]